jgi:hypothetical protein
VFAADHHVVECGADVRERHVLGRACLRLACHVPQHVHMAELAVHSGEDAVDMVGVGHVPSDRQCLATEFADVVCSCLDAGHITIEQHEIGSSLGQRERHGTVHALCASGHDGDAVAQIEQIGNGL